MYIKKKGHSLYGGATLLLLKVKRAGCDVILLLDCIFLHYMYNHNKPAFLSNHQNLRCEP